MSITVEYFFNHDLELNQLTDVLNSTIGFSFAPYDGDQNDMYCRFMGMELTVCMDHGLENDRDCNFEDYAYQLSTRTPIPDGDLRRLQVESMAMLAFVLFCRLDVGSGLLTFDAQQVLARYYTLSGRWHDELSGKDVSFPGHFVEVRSRIERDGWVA